MKNNWQIKTLGEICTLDTARNTRSGLPYVGMEDIESGTGRFLGSLDAKKVKGGSFSFTPQHLLYGRLRPYLNKVMMPDFTGHCSTEVFPIRVKDELDRKFLFYWITDESIVKLIDATCTGARMPRANLKEVFDFSLPVPSLPEQRRIVAILDDVFERVAKAKANAEKNLANAREVFESFRKDVFYNQEGKKDKLEDLCSIKHGFAFKSEYFRDSGDYVLLTPGNFYEPGGYRDRVEKQKYYVGEIPNGFILNEGDLLVAMTEQAEGLLGSPMFVPEKNKFLHNQRLGLVEIKDKSKLDPNYLFHFFNTGKIRKSIHKDATGVKVRHTSPTKLLSLNISLPPIKEQRTIVSNLDALSSETKQLEAIYRQKLSSLEELKKSVLRSAFRGEL
ncbi:MAG: restriction endonuclease subunit S [Candidatus Kapaibacterium sp.]